MRRVTVVHDAVHGTLTVWLRPERRSALMEEIVDDVVLRKDDSGRVIGIELRQEHAERDNIGMSVETVLLTGP
jgi:uncharacterized protein YuzE